MEKLIKLDDAIEACSEAQGRSDSKGFLRGVSAVWQKIKKLQTVEPDEILHWISAKDWLPNESGTFIICTSHGDVFVAYYWHEREEFTRGNGTNFYSPVVYWQPLPQPPKGENS